MTINQFEIETKEDWATVTTNPYFNQVELIVEDRAGYARIALSPEQAKNLATVLDTYAQMASNS